ncbi:MAG: type secretion protein Rhs [Firmicutes bacterium]|nr:type secretion protein Rhs [Bacillota bacterium]
MNLGRIAKGTKGVKRAAKAAKAAKRAAKLAKAIKNAKKLGKVVVGTRILKKTAETESELAKLGEALKRGKKASKDLSKFNFGKYLKSKIGGPPIGMKNPHAHHILFKKGLGEAQKELVKEGQEILRKHGIDPIYGVENLCWAPNAVKGQHSIDALKNVVNKLKEADMFGGTKQHIVETLKELGNQAAKRGGT